MIHPMSDVQSKNIGKDTNIWQFCVVLPNAVINKNALVETGCGVTKDVPANTIIK